MSFYKLFFHHQYTRTALVGGGGKTSIMASCAAEAKQRNLFLLMSTTTRLQRITRDSREIPGIIHIGDKIPQNSGWPLLWLGGDTEGGRKWIGPPARELRAVLDQNRQSSGYIGNQHQTVLIEADGSAGRPVKAPGKNEPVIPPQVDSVVAVMGLSALGQEVGEETIHRLENFLSLTGISPGETITPKRLSSLIVHPEGSFKGALTGMRRILILNQADSTEDVHQAEKIIDTVKNMKRNRSRSSGKFPDIIAVTSFRKNHPIRSIINL